MEAAIREQLRHMDSDMPVAEVQTIDELVTARTGPERFTTLLLGVFAMVGLALAVTGTYGVISYLVSQRTREFAVRLALGAHPRNILWLILRQGLKMAAVGTVIGLFGAWIAQRIISGLLFGISAADPITFAGGASVLIAVAALASGIPGVRARLSIRGGRCTRINPLRWPQHIRRIKQLMKVALFMAGHAYSSRQKCQFVSNDIPCTELFRVPALSPAIGPQRARTCRCPRKFQQIQSLGRYR